MQEAHTHAMIWKPKRRLSLLALLVTTHLFSCGDKDAMPSQRDKFRCPEPGLCLHATGTQSLQGGYREGDDELKFDIIHRPFRGFSVGEVFPWCMRLIDHKNQQFYTHDNGKCPASWARGDGLQKLVAEESYLAAFRRDDLARSMKKLLPNAETPRGRTVAMEVLLDVIDTVVNSADDPGHIHTPVQRSKMGAEKANYFRRADDDEDAAVTEDATAEDEVSWPADTQIRPSNAVKEEADASSRLAVPPSSTEEDVEGELLDHDEWPLQKQTGSPFASSAETTAMPLALLSKGDPNGIPAKSPEEIIEEPGWEFRQELVLYSQSVKARIWWGRRTKKHHTASYIEVMKRPLGSTQPWARIAFAFTRNHGASPVSAHMKPYAWCKDTPTTYGRTVWKGECHGGWGLGHFKHLCNDDTRLQIRNAYNIASNKLCEKVDSYHRPWCDTR